MQPSHASDDMRWADARLGPGRVDGAYAWRWFVDAGVAMAYGSDFPVEIVNPFWGIYAAITRQDTRGPSRGRMASRASAHARRSPPRLHRRRGPAAFAEDRLGILKTGYRADISVLDRDLFHAQPREILSTKVLMTIVDGKIAFGQP